MRLGIEVSGLKGLQKQAKCYLAALNTLRLVNSNYAWIVKPANSLNDEEELNGTSVKHTLDGEELEIPSKLSSNLNRSLCYLVLNCLIHTVKMKVRN